MIMFHVVVGATSPIFVDAMSARSLTARVLVRLLLFTVAFNITSIIVAPIYWVSISNWKTTPPFDDVCHVIFMSSIYILWKFPPAAVKIHASLKFVGYVACIDDMS